MQASPWALLASHSRANPACKHLPSSARTAASTCSPQSRACPTLSLRTQSALAQNTAKKERLEVEVEQCSLKLGRAEQLIGGWW